MEMRKLNSLEAGNFPNRLSVFWALATRCLEGLISANCLSDQLSTGRRIPIKTLSSNLLILDCAANSNSWVFAGVFEAGQSLPNESFATSALGPILLKSGLGRPPLLIEIKGLENAGVDWPWLTLTTYHCAGRVFKAQISHYTHLIGILAQMAPTVTAQIICLLRWSSIREVGALNNGEICVLTKRTAKLKGTNFNLRPLLIPP